MVTLDARVVTAIRALPLLEPAPGFEQRVMARVAVGAHARPESPWSRSPRAIAARRRGVIAAVLAGGAMAAGFGVGRSASRRGAPAWPGRRSVTPGTPLAFTPIAGSQCQRAALVHAVRDSSRLRRGRFRRSPSLQGRTRSP